MLLHIGENEGIPLERILFVLNAEKIQPVTREYVNALKKARRYRSCHGTAKTYVITRENGRDMAHESMIASATLEKRWRAQLSRTELNSLAVLSVTNSREEENEGETSDGRNGKR